jgi:hypothetical protein
LHRCLEELQLGPDEICWHFAGCDFTQRRDDKRNPGGNHNMATGLYFKNERAEWEESEEPIELLPNNAWAIARKGRTRQFPTGN